MRFHKLVWVVLGVALIVVAAVLILPFAIGDDLSYLGNEKVAYLIRLAEEEEPDAPVAASAEETTKTAVALRAEVVRDYVLIGDSRTRGLNQATGISQSGHFIVIAENSMGYYWMMEEALPKADASGLTEYVILLGVNDMENEDRYLAAYNKLAERGIHVTLVTVGPVEEGKGGYSVTNYRIDKFNERLYEAEGADVIDLNAYLWKHGFSTMDGLHYTDETYRLIEEFLLVSLE